MRRERERPQPPEPVRLEHVVRLARETLLRDGYHAPTLVVDGSRRVLVVQITELASEHTGRVEQMVIAGRVVAREGQGGQLRRVYFVCEGWMSLARDGVMPGMLPSQDPQRKEVLVVTGIDVRTRQTETVLYEMVRDGQGELRELVDVDQPAGGSADSPLLDAFVFGYTGGSAPH
jgi:hypothetical protein